MTSTARRRTAKAAPTLLAHAIGLVLGGSSLAAAAAPEPESSATASAEASDAADPARSPTELESVTVEGRQETRPASPKYTQPLLDTPQTINIVTKDVIEGQNLLTLRDILITVPGITFGAGEGGGGYGDSINLRGFGANNDIAIDGIRDSAQYNRNDTFNLEQVEVVNGSSSVYAGSGAVGGTINLVSKTAQRGDFTRLQAGVGTDSYGRAAVDSNWQFSEAAALRINAMAHRNDVPGREVEEFDRWGFAPSIAFGLDGDTNLSLSYLHQEEDNTPQYGVPFYNGEPLPGVDHSEYFGYRNIDNQDIEIDQVTARVDHQFSDTMSISNITRSGQTDQVSIVDPPQGTYCLDNALTPLGMPCLTNQPPGTYQPSGPRGNRRDTTNDILATQTDLRIDFATGAVEHNAVVGFALTHESYDLLTGNVLRNPDGTVPVLPITDYRDPDDIWRGPVNYIPASRQAGELDTRAIYAFDTLSLNPQWELNFGTRYERSEGTHRTDTIATPATGGAVTNGQEFVNDDNLFSYRGGVVYKPVENASIYLAYGNSETPSKASVNGACTAQTCAVAPESAVLTELGAKWSLLDDRLMLTASVFRNDRENFRVPDPGNPDNPSGVQQLDGEARVDGVSLGAYGLIREDWAVYASYTHLESEVLQGVSDLQASQGLDYTRGDPLLQVPEDAFSLWTTYDLNRQWQFGYGVTYQGEIFVTQHSATNIDGPLVTADSFTIHRLAATYRATRNLSLQLNINNAADEVFYIRVRNNGWATPGEGRQITLTANYNF